jgi:hypothetical protein
LIPEQKGGTELIRIFSVLLIAAQMFIAGVWPLKQTLITAQNDLTLQELLLRTKNAAGGNAWDGVRTLRIRWKAKEGGLHGVVIETDDLASMRYKDTSDFGIRSGAYAFNREVISSQDSSGISHVEESSGVRAATINEAYRRSVAYWYSQRWPATIDYKGQEQDGDQLFHILSVAPERGKPFELWFDGKTWLLSRILEPTDTGMLKVFLSDYRAIQNIKVPFLVRVQLPTGAENTYEAEKVEVNTAFPDTNFSIPPPPAPDFSIAGNSDSATMPIEMINNHTYVRARLNNRGPFRFVVDTGWGTSSITPEVAKTLGLTIRGSQKTVGAGEGVAEVAFTKVASMQIGNVHFRSQSLIVTSAFDGKTRDAVGDFGGLIGYELFKRFVVKLDFDAGTMTLTLPARFTYQGKGTTIPFKLSNTIPLVRGEVDGVEGEFIVDSGFPGALTTYNSFNTKNRLIEKLKPRLQAITGWGIGGPVRAAVVRSKVFKLGDESINDLLLQLSLLTKGSQANTQLAGAIGSELLKRFTVTFDYSRGLMFLERNKSFGHRQVFDRSGMYLNKRSNWFEVMEVVEGGPADRAGIRLADRIVSIDGRKASGWTLPDVWLKLRGPVNTRINMTVERAKSTHQVVVVLKDLV